MKNRLASLTLTSIFLLATALSSGSARAADPVISDPASTSIGIVKGADPGEGLDLDGNFVYALSIGAEPDFSAKVRSATFQGLIDEEVPGATLVAGNRILNWYKIDYGDSPDDDTLEAATSSIRWSQAGSGIPELILTLENLQVGAQYKVQMMFGEQCCNRGFDLFFDDILVVKDFNPGVVQEGIANGSQEALITHTFIAKNPTLVMRFDGNDASSDFPDHNAILNAVTVEELASSVDTDKDGLPDEWETRHGLNPNDASDAAKDCNNNGVSNLDEFKANLDPCDTTPPTVLSATTTGTFDTVTVTFSKDLDPATATETANYAFSPSLAVTAATYKNKVVTLTTAKQTPGATLFTVTVTGVQDLSKNKVPADSKATFYSYLLTKTGVLRFAFWGDIPGTPVSNLFNDPRYPANPDMVGPVFSFNSRDIFPNDSHNNFGATIEGFLTPTETASYDFFLRSDDGSELLLSTDDKEANLQFVAEELDCCDAFQEPGTDDATSFAPISLTAGKKYFIQVNYKEGGGGDFAQVAWRKVGDTTPAALLKPIPGKFLSSAVDLPAPADGLFVTQTPAPKAKRVSPGGRVTIAHIDGKTAWTAANVSLKLDGSSVTPTFTKEGTLATIVYTPSTLFASKSTHTVTLGYLDPGGQPATREWSFETLAYSGPTKDKVAGFPGLIEGSAVLTADAGGHTGKAGDYAMDMTRKGGPVEVLDASWAKAAFAKDELTVSFWMKKFDITATTVFRFSSDSLGRAFHGHVPWSDNVIYFDTAGCCAADTQRISANIDTFANYTGDIGFWTNLWHNFVFSKKGGNKQIWIDGMLFLAGDGANPLPSDLGSLYIGSDGPGGSAATHALLDDFAVFSTQLAEADLKSLASGTLPSALPASKGLLAYWDFNAPIVVVTEPPKFTKVSAAAGKVTIEWTGGGTLQKAGGVTGPWADVAGATSPRSEDASGAGAFYRIKQ